ncbi:MAG: hypothetical protein ILP19_02200 [Oscillospiraceae bacterium]|nr:hypothetical protein [Oscillospiraceae bacterium]
MIPMDIAHDPIEEIMYDSDVLPGVVIALVIIAAVVVFAVRISRKKRSGEDTRSDDKK